MSLKKIAGIISFLFVLVIIALFVAKQQINEYLTEPRLDKTQLIVVENGSHFSRLGD
ncbi:MAG: ABC transporter substrate-binding protein, partial [Psychromonas sp.]|nr:ABC transporter substrate-binding protein [Psychromonas sp.]